SWIFSRPEPPSGRKSMAPRPETGSPPNKTTTPPRSAGRTESARDGRDPSGGPAPLCVRDRDESAAGHAPGWKALADDLGLGEPVGDLLRRGLGRVGAVHRVLTDRGREFLADGARIGLGRIGRTHHFAVLQDRVLALEDLNDGRSR